MTQSAVSLSGSLPNNLLDSIVFRLASIDEALGMPSVARISFESKEPDLSYKKFLGQTISMCWQTRSGQRYFHGEITCFERDNDQAGSVSQYQIVVNSWNELLKRRSDFRIYQNQTAIDIVKDVFARHGKASPDFSLKGLSATYPVLEYCVQYGESDFNFVQRILQKEGVYYFFTHTKTSHCMVLCDHQGAHNAFEGYDSLAFSSASGLSGVTENETIARLKFESEVLTPKHVSRDYNFKTPNETLETPSKENDNEWNKQFEHFTHPGYYQDGAVGSHYVKVRQQLELVNEVMFGGVTNARGVAVGCVLTAVEHEIASLSKPMLVTRTQVTLSEPKNEANSQGVSSFECDFNAIPEATVFRPALTAFWPRVKGPETAKVVGPKNEEIQVDRYGRIRVHFFWDRHTEDTNPEASCWIRVAQPWAGEGWGFISTPRIGQEVVVAFEGGDPDRPLIVGSVYNEVNSVPYDLPGQKNVSGWRSRSTLKGGEQQFNEFRFDDTMGKEYIWLQAQRDFNQLVKRNNSQEIGSNSDVLIRGNSLYECQGNVDTQVKGKVSEKFTGTWSVHVADDANQAVDGQFGLESQSDMNLATRAQLSAEASTSAHVKAGVSISISAGQTISLKAGPSSITLGPAGIHITGPIVAINSGGGGSSASPKSPDAPEDPKPPKAPVDPLK